MATYYNNLWLSQSEEQAARAGLQINKTTGTLDNLLFTVTRVGQEDSPLFTTHEVLALQGFVLGFTEGRNS